MGNLVQPLWPILAVICKSNDLYSLVFAAKRKPLKKAVVMKCQAAVGFASNFGKQAMENNSVSIDFVAFHGVTSCYSKPQAVDQLTAISSRGSDQQK